MIHKLSPFACKPLPTGKLVDIHGLLAAYTDMRPDPAVQAQGVAFGISGHRGTSFERSFDAWHVLAITQALCEHRNGKSINGPLFIGVDTHALSMPAFDDALETLAANSVETMIASVGESIEIARRYQHWIDIFELAKTAATFADAVSEPTSARLA